MKLSEVQRIVDEYLREFPKEAAKLAQLQRRLEVDEVFNNRTSFQGHGTGGAYVLSPGKRRILLIHHVASDKWIQPGGHWDPEDPHPWTVARREVQEETGVEIAQLIPIVSAQPHVPLIIRTFFIPERPRRHEPAHYHYDFGYAFVAANTTLHLHKDEISEAAWIPIDSDDKRLTEVADAIRKLRACGIIT